VPSPCHVFTAPRGFTLTFTLPRQINREVPQTAPHVFSPACSRDSCAELPFDSALDLVTGRDPAGTDYIFSEPAKCPRCRGDVTEKTLIEFDPEVG
jgi:hypothetical protein